jgi:hypothetical protein
MKWAYSIRNKFAAAVILFVALGIIFMNNLYERNNSAKINASIATIYEDRLMVESYIYQYSDQLHRIIEIIDETENQKFISHKLNTEFAEINALNAAYEKTKLTPEEKISFDEFSLLCAQMQEEVTAGNLIKGKTISRKALNILNTLSDIQISEARLERRHAEQLFSSSSIFSNVEMVVLIIIAIMIQALIFASKTLRFHAMPRNPGLN